LELGGADVREAGDRAPIIIIAQFPVLQSGKCRAGAVTRGWVNVLGIRQGEIQCGC